MVELTTEQIARIEENRRKALERLSERKSNNSVDNISQNNTQSSTEISQPKNQKTLPQKSLKIDFELESLDKFSVSNVYQLRQLFLSVVGYFFRQEDKRWIFPLANYSTLVNHIKERLPDAELDLIPNQILKLVNIWKSNSINQEDLLSFPLSKLFSISHSIFQDKYSNDHSVSIESLIDEKLKLNLLPFQIVSIKFALERQGRILLADDMGLGKTVQALTIACCYRREWPLLVITPASLVATWVDAIQEWLPSISSSSIWAMYGSNPKNNIPVFSGLINIISYDMAVKYHEDIQEKGFNIAIIDESHFLRHDTTKRCQYLLPIAKKMSRLIMLSGTPALSRPMELFTQLQALKPTIFPKKVLYGVRYCAGHKDHFGWDFKGSSHLKELSIILEHSIMLRRLKQQVLTQLPPKRRQQVSLHIDSRNFDSKSMDEHSNLLIHDSRLVLQSKEIYLKLWRDTALAKIKAIQQYLLDLMSSESEKKILLFAHHIQVLDELEQSMQNQKIGYIRIDGSTSGQERQRLCSKFQSSSHNDIRIALLSITAAGVGLTLTSASIVIFGELFWNPGILMQAEDRAHRIGQTGDCVSVRYLLAKGTFDDKLWPLILKKLTILEEVGLSTHYNDFVHMRQEGQDIQNTMLNYLYVD